MTNLYNYIEKYITTNKMHVDAHIHLFDWETKNIFDLYNPRTSFNKFVGFLGVDFYNVDKYTYEDCIKYYDNFIESNKSKDILLLASGLDAKTVIQNYENHRDVICGFGELLCYDEYDRIKLPYRDLNWIKEILDYNTSHLPVYIHYSLVSDEYYKEIDDLISKYPDTPIVICHCGLPNIHEGNYKKDFDTIFERFLRLQIKYKNVYTDVCDSAFPYFKNNRNKLFKLDLNRVLIGTDLGPIYFREMQNGIERKVSKSLQKFKLWGKSINNEYVVKKLFRI